MLSRPGLDLVTPSRDIYVMGVITSDDQLSLRSAWVCWVADMVHGAPVVTRRGDGVMFIIIAIPTLDRYGKVRL
jgi:hypothetical protein